MESMCCGLHLDSRRMTRLLRLASVFMLWLAYTYAETTTTAPSTSTSTSTTTTTTTTQHSGPSKKSSSGSLDMKTIITLSVTFPAGLILGVVWCWCMSKVCGTGQRPPKARLNHTLTAVTRVHLHDQYDE